MVVYLLVGFRYASTTAIGSEIDEDSVDTELPLITDNAEISPESKEIPSARTGFTEMIFCLARCELITLN